MATSGSVVPSGSQQEQVKSPEAALHRMLRMVGYDLTVLEAARLDLSDKCGWFDIRRYVLPIECHSAITALQKLERLVQSMSSAIGDVRELPFSFMPARYQLLVPLSQVNQQIQTVTPLIEALRLHTFDASPKTLSQQQHIYNQLVHLVDACKEIERQGLALIDRMSAQVA